MILLIVNGFQLAQWAGQLFQSTREPTLSGSSFGDCTSAAGRSASPGLLVRDAAGVEALASG